MNLQQRNDISLEMERLALELRREMNVQETDPISIHKILKEKGILCLFRELDRNFSGMAIRTLEENSAVYRFMLVNSAQGYGKQRFTCCHELYHLLYQKDFFTSRNNAGTFNDKNIEEYKADVFATFLLLPSSGVRQSIPVKELSTGIVSLQTVISIEQRFRCSRIALLRRLDELKLIKKDLFNLYSCHPMRSAVEYGYSKDLYLPTFKNEVVGDYNIKARLLFDSGLISQAKYYELLSDMGIDLECKEGDNGEI